MSDRKPFLLRLDPRLHEALQKWADDELRSLNGQIEFLLRQSLMDKGRWKDRGADRGTRSEGRGTREKK